MRQCTPERRIESDAIRRWIDRRFVHRALFTSCEMEKSMKHRILLLLAAFPFAAAHAGGSNYGITPGTLPNIAGKVSEWPVPTPRFARDPAIAPDCTVFITVMT